MTDKVLDYARSFGNCEKIKQKRHFVEAVKKFKCIDLRSEVYLKNLHRLIFPRIMRDHIATDVNMRPLY